MCCLKIMSRDILCTLGIPHSNANEETIFKVHLSIKLPLGFLCLLWISILVDIFITTRIMSWIHMTFIKGISQVQLMYFIIYKMYVFASSIYVREREREISYWGIYCCLLFYQRWCWFDIIWVLQWRRSRNRDQTEHQTSKVCKTTSY